jgi:hypothetical protein
MNQKPNTHNPRHWGLVKWSSISNAHCYDCKQSKFLGSFWKCQRHIFIVVTYFQFDSNIHVLYVFLGFLKNTWKYLIQRPIFKPLYNYNVFKKILENTSFWAPSKNTHISYVTTMHILLPDPHIENIANLNKYLWL